MEPAAADRQNHRGLLSVARLVKGDLTCYALVVLRRGDRVAELVTLGRSGPLDRFCENDCAVVTEGSHVIGWCTVFRFEFSDEILHVGRFVFGAEMAREE